MDATMNSVGEGSDIEIENDQLQTAVFRVSTLTTLVFGHMLPSFATILPAWPVKPPGKNSKVRNSQPKHEQNQFLRWLEAKKQQTSGFS